MHRFYLWLMVVWFVASFSIFAAGYARAERRDAIRLLIMSADNAEAVKRVKAELNPCLQQ